MSSLLLPALFLLTLELAGKLESEDTFILSPTHTYC